MNPNEVLCELREWAWTVISERPECQHSHDETTAADHFVALDKWITRGGFIPRDWEANTTNR